MAATLFCSRQPGVASNSSRTRADPASYYASSIIKDDLSKLMATRYSTERVVRRVATVSFKAYTGTIKTKKTKGGSQQVAYI